MANSPVSLILPQYDIDDAPAAGYYLKGYQAGTTTPITMYTDAAGSSSLVKAALDANGFPITSGNVKFTPHFAEEFDLWLFPDAASADANDTSSATQITDTGILLNRFDNVINFKNYNPAGDGSTDDYAKLVSALSAAAGKILVIEDGDYSFSNFVTVPTKTTIICSQDVRFIPSFEPTGVDRQTPLITFGVRCNINYLEINLPSGINTIRKGVQFSGYCNVGTVKITSVDFNNNRTESGSTDLESGAVFLNGENISIDSIEISRFDAAIGFISCTNIAVRKTRIEETVRGIYGHGSRDIHFGVVYATGPSTHSEVNAFNRGIMTPGANGILLGGVTDSSFDKVFLYDVLEHGVRIGAQQAGTSVPNVRLNFGDLRIYRAYGCGFKSDDSDAFAIKDIHIGSLYTEDIGKDNWFGTGGYENWQSGGVNNPALNNDGNKQSCAVRNTERFTLGIMMNRILNHSESGHFGLWLEKTNQANVGPVDIAFCRDAGVVIQDGASRDINDITIRGVKSRENGGYGVWLRPVATAQTWRGVAVTGIDATDNTTYDVRVDARPDSSSPFATKTSRIEGYADGVISIAANVEADVDFINDVRPATTELGSIIYSGYTPSGTVVTNLDSVTGLTNTAYYRIGNLVTVFGQINADPTATGNAAFRIDLPIASNFTATKDAAGTFAGEPVGSTEFGSISADTANNEALFRFVANQTSEISYQFTFSYKIL